MKQNKFPLGWDDKRVKETLTHYESQTEEEAVAEDEAAFEVAVQAAIDILEQDLRLKSNDFFNSR